MDHVRFGCRFFDWCWLRVHDHATDFGDGLDRFAVGASVLDALWRLLPSCHVHDAKHHGRRDAAERQTVYDVLAKLEGVEHRFTEALRVAGDVFQARACFSLVGCRAEELRERLRSLHWGGGTITRDGPSVYMESSKKISKGEGLLLVCRLPS